MNRPTHRIPQCSPPVRATRAGAGPVRLGATALALGLLLCACLGTPDRAVVVQDFELQRYLGSWYEIARLDHRFERGLSHVTAEYALRDDGSVQVINRGYNDEEGEWESAEGKAYFIDGADVGRLKVSFFGPFYGAYNIIALDQENYQYSMVAGPDTGYLWILAREPQLDPAILERLLSQAADLGFPVSGLIYPEQGAQSPPESEGKTR